MRIREPGDPLLDVEVGVGGRGRGGGGGLAQVGLQVLRHLSHAQEVDKLRVQFVGIWVG